MQRKRVVIESPFRGRHKAEEARNVAYLHRAMRHSLSLGEAPFASHELYTRALDDSAPEEREAGIDAGLSWGMRAELVAVYLDLGASPGMLISCRAHASRGVRIEARWLDLHGGARTTAGTLETLERGLHPYVSMLEESGECEACGDAFPAIAATGRRYCSVACMHRADRLIDWARRQLASSVG